MADKWIEKELARQLTPVAAPETLWDRVSGHVHDGQARSTHRVRFQWILWPVAAALVLATVGRIVLSSSEDRFTERELALRAAKPGFDYRTGDFDDARAWVKTRAGIDIDLPTDHWTVGRDAAVRLIGVRMVESRGLPIAAIDYEVNGETATLFVSGKRAGLTGNDMGPSQHLRSRRGLTYWNMRNETYTIAFGSERNSRGACLLCHASLPAQGS